MNFSRTVPGYRNWYGDVTDEVDGVGVGGERVELWKEKKSPSIGSVQIFSWIDSLPAKMYKPSSLLQHNHDFASRGALLLIRDRVRDRLESSSSATVLGAKELDLVRLHAAVLEELGDDGDDGDDVFVDGRIVRGRVSGFANHTEEDLVGGEGVILGFGRPGCMLIARFSSQQ